MGVPEERAFVLEPEGEDYLDYKWWARAFLMNAQPGQREGGVFEEWRVLQGSWSLGQWKKESKDGWEGTCWPAEVKAVLKASQQWNTLF